MKLKLPSYILLSLLQIGSSPGFEDGDFESAKLRRPAGSYYHATDNCLYFLDSEVCIWMYMIITIRFLPRFITFDENYVYIDLNWKVQYPSI